MRGFVALTVSGVVGFVIVGALLFGPAGTLDYWQAWTFLVIFTVMTTVPNGPRDCTESSVTQCIPAWSS